MGAYHDSMYGTQEVTEGMKECLDVVYMMKDKEVRQEKAKADHVKWVRSRQVRP